MGDFFGSRTRDEDFKGGAPCKERINFFLRRIATSPGLGGGPLLAAFDGALFTGVNPFCALRSGAAGNCRLVVGGDCGVGDERGGPRALACRAAGRSGGLAGGILGDVGGWWRTGESGRLGDNGGWCGSVGGFGAALLGSGGGGDCGGLVGFAFM